MAANDAKHAVELTLTLDELKRQAQNAEAVIQNAVKRMSGHPVSIKVDDSHVNAYYKNLEVKQKQLAQQQQLLQAAAVKASRQSTMQSVQLAQQVQDFGIQVAGGQNPLLAAVQQGSQLSFIYGGVGNAMKALLGLITPVNVGLGALAAVAGTAAYAYFQLKDRNEEYTKSLIKTGGALQQTQGQFDAMIKRVDELNKLSGAGSRGVISAVAETGLFNGAEIEKAAAALVLFGKVTGKTEKEVAQSFAEMRKGPYEWARANYEATGMFTAAQLEQIRILDGTGKKQEAFQIALKALQDRYNEENKQRLEDLRGPVDLLADSFKKLSVNIVNAFSKAFNPAPLEERIKAIQFGIEKGMYKGKELLDMQRELASLQGKMPAQSLYEDANLGGYAQAKRDAEKWKPQEEEFRRKIASSSVALSLAKEEASIAEKILAVNKVIELTKRDMLGTDDELQQIQYQALINEQERAKKLLEIQQLQAQIRNVYVDPASPEQAIQAEARKLKLLEQIKQKQQEIALLPGVKQLGSTADEKELQRVKKLLEERNKDAIEMAKDLDVKVKEINASYITDVTLKAQQELQIEAEKYRKKIELAEAGSEARKQAEEAYLSWFQARQDKIFDDFQRRTDAMRGMSEGIKAYLKEMEDKGKKAEELTKQTLQGIEDSLVSLVTTGKLNARSLINTIIAEFYRLRVIKPLMAEIFGGGGSGSGLFGSLFSFIGGASSGGGLFSTPSGSGAYGYGLFSSGGYTGVGGVTEPAGIVHKGEFVMPKSAVDKIGLSKLMAMKNGGGSDTPVINISIDSSTDRAQVSRLVAQGVQAGISTYHNQVSRGLV